MKTRLSLPSTVQRTTLALSLSVFSLVLSAREALAATPAADIFGTIEKPAGVDKYDTANGGSMGLMLFVSNLIKLASVVAGLWVMINFILAGWTLVTSSGDSAAFKKATDKMTMSIIGIAIIVASYTIAALLGLVLFGRADYILNPTLEGI